MAEKDERQLIAGNQNELQNHAPKHNHNAQRHHTQ